MRAACVRLLLVSVFAAGLAACTDQSPAAPTGVILPPGLLNPSLSGWAVAGTVWNHTAHGTVPATTGVVFGWVETPRVGYSTGRVDVSPDGRYQFQVPTETTRVYVTGSVGGHQPCPATATPSGDVTLDVHVVTDANQLNGHLPGVLQAQQPTLSGVVYEQTLGGRQPLANAWVTLDALGGMGVLIADTLSGSDGGYVLCGVPQTRNVTVVVGAPGYDLVDPYSSGDLTGRTTLDIEMRRSAN
jgi:hypothetical protein